ncbi:hypothetical protein MXMO3_01695 [Maritalea myrionectae]|uniref:Uncharacterized protein n=1 Tax=Maritalea myrionectae TaxID=454601 RepID=A0A2R4MDV3_9HYPH|nr:hypothetical protein MXMO3_01695 [Maritalea myrionectae]
MTFTISFGWWLAPALTSMLFFVLAVGLTNYLEKSPEGRGIIGAGFSGIAAVASLIVWLIWAVLK